MRGNYRLRPFNSHLHQTTTYTNPNPQLLKNPRSIEDSDVLKWNKSITTHMRNGQVEAALGVFNSMPCRNVVSYNSLISGYVSNGMFDKARDMFQKMPERDLFSWNLMLRGCLRNKNVADARDLFERMPERDAVSWNTMLSVYAQHGYVDEATELFDKMPCKNEISWNGLLAAYVQNGRIEEAKRLFESKMDWEIVSWNCLMGAFVRRKRLVDARRLFDNIPMRDEVSWNTMISGYAQNGELEEARRLFGESPVRDVYTWTAMISGYVQNGMLSEARSVFDKMPEKNSTSWNAMIAGYVQSKKMDNAMELFEAMPSRNISSWNTMITGYAQIGDITQARSLFDKMPQHDSISWSAMIAGYEQNGFIEEALQLFVEMKRNGERLIRSSFTCALAACANLASLELGRQVHCRVVKAGYLTGYYVGNALLAMYCKCGSITEAHDVFKEIVDKDVVSWNTIICGYARHGFGPEALKVFESMMTAGVNPDNTTMVAVLSACSHSGLSDRGIELFHSMKQNYGIIASPVHYSCMVDLLGRAGRFEEAQNLIKDMPFEPDAATWGALLAASRIHGNTELAEKAAAVIFEREPDNPGMYVLLSNLYAASRRWEDVGKMRLQMRNKGVKKVPGYSWLEVQNKIHTFASGDCWHPESKKVYTFLEDMYIKMKHEGYMPSTNLVFRDVEEEEKEQMVKHHSEKLAVAYGILSIPAGRPIRIMKNLRVCEDCHNAIKYMSKISGRLIILRDNHRFHHFDGGSCSCGDYW